MSVTAQQVEEVLTALAEEFLVDVPAYFDDKGTYLIDYTELVSFLLGLGEGANRHEQWRAELTEYINLKEQGV